MIVVNFAHRFITYQSDTLKRFASQSVDRILSVATHIDDEQMLVAQIIDLVGSIDLNPDQ